MFPFATAHAFSQPVNCLCITQYTKSKHQKASSSFLALILAMQFGAQRAEQTEEDFSKRSTMMLDFCGSFSHHKEKKSKTHTDSKMSTF